MEEQKKVRCAIYTRKSTDEGLDKEFNTLEAQREAGANYILSQKHQGWILLDERYDDGGFSGGNINRPALKRLIHDVEAGKIDMIVVYKIDRLTRSLADFSKLIEVLDKHKCSFVSVTQNFNTYDSMGRLSGLDLDDLMNVQTFLRVEHRIIVELRERVLHSIEITDNKDIIAYVKKRQDCHWASNMLKDTAVARTVYNRLYEAILNVSNMVVATNSLQALANIEDFDALYNLYTKELYKIDTLYRHSIEAIQFVQSKGIEVLKPLLQFAEDTYNNKYIETLGVKINRTINFALAQGWKVRDAHNQYDFFTRFVKTPVENEKRVFVIISDGLRYEVASELAARINSQYRMKAELDSMLGVLPSYTALGMAALLPHSTLDYNEKGEVLIDDKPTMSLEQRKVFLAPYKGTAIKMEDFLNMGREEGRNFIKPYNLIYIYHNQIDATGDAAKTEENTFVAVTDTITKMNDLIVHLINNLSANHILLTSDHGFLFQYSKPDATDRSVDEEDFSGAIISKKRYVIGYDLPKSANSIQYNTKVTAKTEKETEFSLPKGASLYNFIGGSRFVHGGAMPQEFIVPMLQIRQIKDEKKKETTRTKTYSITWGDEL